MSIRVVLGRRSERPMSGPELMDIAQQSVVRLEFTLEHDDFVTGGHGTAFVYKQVIDDSRGVSDLYLVTNLHNFQSVLRFYPLLLELLRRGAQAANIRMSARFELDGATHEVDRFIAAKGAFFTFVGEHLDDFALFRVEVPSVETRAVFATPHQGEPLQGERIFAMGFPRDTDLGITDGVVSHVYGDSPSVPAHRWQIQHNVLINPGNSGGPTVTEHGVAVGLSTWGRTDMTGVNFSVNLGHTFERCRNLDSVEEVSLTGIRDRFIQRALEEARTGS